VIVKFSRRKFMVAAGAATLVLPALEALEPPVARGQTVPPAKRLLVIMTPNGTPQKNWFPTPGASETDFKLGPILTPLEPHRADLLVVGALDSTSAMKSNGDPHGLGMATMLNGAKALPGTDFKHGACFMDANCVSSGWGGGITVDQLIGNQFEKQGVVFGSLNYSIKNVPGSLWTRMSYSAPGMPITPEADPGSAFDRAFMKAAGAGMTSAALARTRARQKSALDDLAGELARLDTRISAADKTRLDAHLTSVRKLEDQLARADMMTMPSTCVPPTRSSIGAGVAVQRNNGGIETNNSAMNDTDLMTRHTVWQDLIVRALSCDVTRVVTMIMAPSRSDTYFPWLGFTDPHHALSHADDVTKLTQIDNWYAGRVASYVAALKAEKDVKGDSLMKNTVVLWANELGRGADHTFNNKPHLIVGSGGGYFKTGRYVQYPTGTPHNVLLTAIAQSMGVQTDHVGDPELKTGDITKLKA
jgi:hypothetical protein